MSKYFENCCANVVEHNYGTLYQTITNNNNNNNDCETCQIKLQENTRALRALEAKIDLALQAFLVDREIKDILTNQLSLFE